MTEHRLRGSHDEDVHLGLSPDESAMVGSDFWELRSPDARPCFLCFSYVMPNQDRVGGERIPDDP
jgi:hypothetical protein